MNRNKIIAYFKNDCTEFDKVEVEQWFKENRSEYNRLKYVWEKAGITKEVVLSSAINIIEIWDRENYEKVIEETAENFAELAEEVMGDDEESIS